jgi:hypothetical protein
MEKHFWEIKPRFLFRTSILLAVALAFFLGGCSAGLTGKQSEGPTDACGAIEPTEANVKYTLNFGKSAFTSKDWSKSYTVEPYKISLTRKNDAESAVAYSEFLIYTCGYGQKEMNEYFNDEGFKIVFEGYESHALGKFCEQKSLALYEYDLVNESTDYKARYWVKQNSDTSILVMLLVFPKADSAKLDQYSKIIFPELTSCQ